MVLPENVPDEAGDREKEIIIERTPNYCHECGEEVVIAGGRLNEEDGFYPHIDPQLMCSRGCWQDRFAMGTEGDGEEGREYRAPADVSHDDLFPNVAGYCDIHNEVCSTTKDLILSDSNGNHRPVRQYKCPECDREQTITTLSHDP